jgi:hypothetical protein
MAEVLHTSDELPVSSGAGWMQMELLLNKNMPVKKQSAGMMLIACLPVLLCSVFTFSFLQLNKNFFHTAIVNDIPAEFKKPVNHKLPQAGYPDHYISNVHELAKKNNSNFSSDAATYFSATLKNKLEDEIPGRINIENLIKYIPEKKSAIKIDLNILKAFNNHLNFSPDKNITHKNTNKNSWEILVGLGMNISETKHQNLQPYPAAEFKYNVSSRFFIAAGLSLLSPKAGNISGINKTVYVNDIISGISLYNEVTAYGQLRYVDVPLTAGINISKKISFQTGMQASMLITKQQKKYFEPALVVPFSATAAYPPEEFKVQAPGMDYRFIAGVKYKFGKTTAGLFYQQSLQSLSKENTISTTGSRLFTFNLMYRIK